MSISTRVYVIHAPEDSVYFERLSEQARTAKLAVDFDRTPVKQPWVPVWKSQCYTRVYRCSGVVVLLSKNTNTGTIGWELECARKFELPMLGVQVDRNKTGLVPQELVSSAVIEWSWPEIARFIQSLATGSSATA